MMPEPITNTDALQAFCDRIALSKFITVDTEFIREKTYYPQLCLIQVKGDNDDAAIDTLAEGLDLKPFLALLENPEILKVFHAARQDLEIFYYLTGKVPAPLFDSQIAAMVCGLGDQIGYEALVMKLLHKQIDKTSRFTDWSARPLSQRQLEYALGDVTHLYEIYPILEKKLQDSGRSCWLDEEMTILTSSSTYKVEPEQSWKRLKIRGGKPRFLGTVRELSAWREREAQRRNVPRNRIMRDESLLDIASSNPKNARELARARGISDSLAQGKTGSAILKSLQIARNLPEKDLPVAQKKNPPPQGIGPLTDLLRVMLKQQCEKNGVAARLVASGDDLEKIAASDQANVAAMTGWRRELFGNLALDLKHGRIALSADGDKIKLIPLSQIGQN